MKKRLFFVLLLTIMMLVSCKSETNKSQTEISLEPGLYRNGELVQSWEDLLTSVGYSDFGPSGTIEAKAERQSYFESCNGDLVLPNEVITIGNNAFFNCTSLTSVTIPKGVKILEYRAFEDCEGLTSIIIPDGVESIGNHAFADCKNLSDIKISSSVKKFGIGTFYDTKWLENKRQENPLVIINNVLIDGRTCESDVITIPDNVTGIACCAFQKNKNITSVIIPDSVKRIEEYAFDRCSNLTNITIPNSVTEIDGMSFYSCDNLTIYGDTESYAKQYASENDIHFESL